MKLKLPVLLLAAFVCAIVSCHKDDSNSSTANKVKILGTWEMKKIEIAVFADDKPTGDTTIFITPPDYVHFEFKENKQFSESVSQDGEQGTTQGTYTLTGNKLQITANDSGGYDSTTNYVYKINSDQLLLTDTESITSNDNGETHSLKTVVKLWLDKI